MRSIVTAALGIVFVAWLGPAAAQSTALAAEALPPRFDDFRVLRHDLLLDVPRDEAVFNAWFSDVPDLNTLDEFGRASYSFQYFLSAMDRTNFYLRSGDADELAYPFIVARNSEPGAVGRVVARVVDPAYTSDDSVSGGWGPEVAAVAFDQRSTRVTFRLPLSIFTNGISINPNNFALHYFLDTHRSGAETNSVDRGIGRIGEVDVSIRVARWDRPSSGRALLVHVLSVPPTEDGPSVFLAEWIDVRTVRFGPKVARPWWNHFEDVNGDGTEDLVLAFDPDDVGLGCIDTHAWLTGQFVQDFNRYTFVGRDRVRTAPACG